MSKARTFARFTLLAIIVIALGAAIVYFAVLPKVARRVIESVLRDAGIEQTSFNVKGVNLQQLNIQDLELGEPAWASAGDIRATYGLSALWSHRFDTLVLDQVQWRWTVRNGTIDFGFSGQSEESLKPLADFPFDRLEIRHLILTIDHDQRVDRFIANGMMMRVSPTTYNIDLDVTGEDAAQVQVGTAVLRGLAARLRLVVAMSSGEMSVSVRPDSAAAIDDMSMGSDPSALRVSPMRLMLAESTRPLLHWSRSAGLGISAIVMTDGVVQVDAVDARALIPTATASITLARRSGQSSNFSADLTISDATIKHESADIFVAGINASIPFDAEGSASRRGPITVREVAWGDTIFPGFNAIVGCAGQRIDLEGSWDMGDKGRFTIAPVQFDPASPIMHINLTCEHVGLEPWLPLLTDSRAFGTGSVSGIITMDVAPGQPRWFSFARGGLQSDPGGGRIQSKDARALSELLEKSDPRFIDYDQFREIKNRVITALEDFNYERLAIEFKPSDDRIPFSIDVQGKGRQGPLPQELALTVNVNDFLEVIQAAQWARTLADPTE